MAVLTEKQIKYGFDYYHKDDARPKSVVEVSEYDGEDKLIINCTQLEESYSAKAKKRIWMEWCDFLVNNPDTFTELMFCTRMPQELFDAVCAQRRLKRLHIKWGCLSRYLKIRELTRTRISTHWVRKKCIELRAYFQISKFSSAVD